MISIQFRKNSGQVDDIVMMLANIPVMSGSGCSMAAAGTQTLERPGMVDLTAYLRRPPMLGASPSYRCQLLFVCLG